MSKKNIFWKALALIVLIGILNNVWEILHGEIDSYIGSIIINVIYLIFLIGIVGLAFDKRIFLRRIWKFMFAVAALMFAYSIVISAIAFSGPIKLGQDISNAQVLYVLAMYFIKLIILFLVVYAMFHYAYKREHIWRNNTT